MKDQPYRVNIESPVPVYVQLEQQIQYRIASGTAKPGEHLPSVRELSEQAGVNANTVSKVYRDLLLMGLVHTRRGVGVTVTNDGPRLCRERVRTSAKNLLKEAVQACISAGVPTADVLKLVARAADGKAEE